MVVSSIISTGFSANLLADDIFKQLIDMRHGAALFHKARFSDAEEFFEQLYVVQKDEQPVKLHRFQQHLTF